MRKLPVWVGAGEGKIDQEDITNRAPRTRLLERVSRK